MFKPSKSHVWLAILGIIITGGLLLGALLFGPGRVSVACDRDNPNLPKCAVTEDGVLTSNVTVHENLRTVRSTPDRDGFDLRGSFHYLVVDSSVGERQDIAMGKPEADRVAEWFKGNEPRIELTGVRFPLWRMLTMGLGMGGMIVWLLRERRALAAVG